MLNSLFWESLMMQHGKMKWIISLSISNVILICDIFGQMLKNKEASAKKVFGHLMILKYGWRNTCIHQHVDDFLCLLILWQEKQYSFLILRKNFGFPQWVEISIMTSFSSRISVVASAILAADAWTTMSVCQVITMYY